MVWSKACPRCKGDLFEERLLGEHEIKCLQCGRVLNEAQSRLILDWTRSFRAERPARLVPAPVPLKLSA